MRSRRTLTIAAFGLLLGLLAAGRMLIAAQAQCGPLGAPCPPPNGEEERERRPTATDTRLGLSIFTATLSETPSPTSTPSRTPTPTPTAPFCLEPWLWMKCLGNPQCQGIPLCPPFTPTPTGSPSATLSPTITRTPTATPTRTATPPQATGTLFQCLEYWEFQKCLGNPQCQGIPLCPWSKPNSPTRTPTPPSMPESMPLGGVSPLALGIAGAVAMLGFAIALQRRYKDRY